MQLAFAGAMLGVFEEAIEGCTVEVFSAEPHGLNLSGVVNVGEGIGGEQNEVSALAILARRLGVCLLPNIRRTPITRCRGRVPWAYATRPIPFESTSKKAYRFKAGR